MNIEIIYQNNLKNLVNRWTSFNQIYDYKYIKKQHRIYEINNLNFYHLQCIFIGKTGYGKSSTLNSIIGEDIFETSDIFSTTRKIQSADWVIFENKNWYFSIADLPGIGENESIDKKYFILYSSILKKSDCYVYLLRADQRDFSLDFQIMEKLKIKKRKLILGLNFIDKIEPLSREYPFYPNEKQFKNIKSKVYDISKKFKILENRIIPYSATECWQLDILIDRIIDILINKKICLWSNNMRVYTKTSPNYLALFLTFQKFQKTRVFSSCKIDNLKILIFSEKCQK